MAERPILFSSPMIRALLDGRKTQTRRVVKLFDGNHADKAGCFRRGYDEEPGEWMQYAAAGAWVPVRVPYAVGDTLWVRETWAGDEDCGCVYRADHPTADLKRGDLDEGEQQIRRWNPSIFMPRWASRLTLLVTDVRVQRVQEISEEDARAEGLVRWTDPPRVPDVHYGIAHADVWEMDPRKTFARLWDSINAKRAPWASNPWVFAITFEKIKEPDHA